VPCFVVLERELTANVNDTALEWLLTYSNMAPAFGFVVCIFVAPLPGSKEYSSAKHSSHQNTHHQNLRITRGWSDVDKFTDPSHWVSKELQSSPTI
jgi:hypothetical protein